MLYHNVLEALKNFLESRLRNKKVIINCLPWVFTTYYGLTYYSLDLQKFV